MERRPGLGRLFKPDERDRAFRMAAVVPRRSPRDYRYWNDRQWRGDQGMTSTCVAFSWLHWLHTGPVTQRVKGATPPIIKPQELYHQAQTLDEWDGEGYDGTSVRAGAKALQARGFISAYHWGESVEDVVYAVLEAGPVVMGTIWTEQMFKPDAKGYITVDGPEVGGHAWEASGVTRIKEEFIGLNSWGPRWGPLGGRFKITFKEMEKLRARQWEACLATEIAG